MSDEDQRIFIDVFQQLAGQCECDLRQHPDSIRVIYASCIYTISTRAALSISSIGH